MLNTWSSGGFVQLFYAVRLNTVVIFMLYHLNLWTGLRRWMGGGLLFKRLWNVKSFRQDVHAIEHTVDGVEFSFELFMWAIRPSFSKIFRYNLKMNFLPEHFHRPFRRCCGVILSLSLARGNISLLLWQSECCAHRIGFDCSWHLCVWILTLFVLHELLAGFYSCLPFCSLCAVCLDLLHSFVIYVKRWTWDTTRAKKNVEQIITTHKSVGQMAKEEHHRKYSVKAPQHWDANAQMIKTLTTITTVLLHY